ncbi:MAG: carbohydrate kinase [Candidatus Omnitrophica bacterium]|nr:carbohydrate kinase [Candidatus Omnitrophota bacterium]MBU1932976.1 carbohydrate kinase [Candidatus Omnitrophota bacterium]
MNIDALFLGGTSIDLIQERRYPEKFSASVGGSITNSAIISAKLGLKTTLLSRIGKDPMGDFAIRTLKSYQVNTSGIIQDPGIRTPLAIAKVDKSGNSVYTFYKNPASLSIVPLKTAPKSLLDSCKFLHFGSSFSYQKETFQEALKYINYLKKRRVFVSFDPNLRPYVIKDKMEARKRVLRLLKLVNMAKLSGMDLEFLTGCKNPEKGLKRLKKLAKCEVILTLGPKGSRYLDKKGNLIKVPAFKVKVADTIGAGDAYTAGILYKIAKLGKREVFDNIRPAMVFASAVSAIICTKRGANQGLKDIKQIKTFLAKRECESAVLTMKRLRKNY